MKTSELTKAEKKLAWMFKNFPIEVKRLITLMEKQMKKVEDERR